MDESDRRLHDEVRARLRELDRLPEPGKRAARAVGDVAVPAWRQVTEVESRVAVSLALIVAIVLMSVPPARIADHPRWLLPALAGVLDIAGPVRDSGGQTGPMRLPDHVVTERLVLRQWTAADEPGLSAAIAASLDHLRPWMPWAGGEPVPAPDRIRWIEQSERDWADGGDVILGMFLPDGTVIGGTGLHRRAGPETLEIGYWVHVDHANRGYATEASRALTDVAFTVPGIEIVELLHDRANIPSRRVPEKLGYTCRGKVLDDPRGLAPEGDGVHISWTVTKADWLAR